MSRVLLKGLIGAFVPEGAPLVFLIDETLEQRRGPKIAYKGAFRDAVRSSAKQVAISLGIRGCCVCLLAKVPWSARPWALPTGLTLAGEPWLNNYATLKTGSTLALQPWQAVVLPLR